MDLDDVNGGLATQLAAEKRTADEVETADNIDIAKNGTEVIDVVAEKKLVRKLDLWYSIHHNC